ncbi:MAG: dihydroneopterin aldolase family protein [Hadesarchaea archaeon]|nr:dihydroneopterin aldolase family protein [Hadesarchaea archaeon]
MTGTSLRDPAKKYFGPDVSDRERAIFEGAITLGAIYHQFIGTPIRDRKMLERTIEQAALAQPFVERASVRISIPKRKRKPPYDYPVLSAEMLTVSLVARYGEARVELGMKYVEELDYPLMFIRR